MITITSGHFLSYSGWFENVIKEDVILCCTSSLEMLGMFDGLYIRQENIPAFESIKDLAIEYYISKVMPERWNVKRTFS